MSSNLKTLEALSNAIPRILQLDRLEKLAKYNPLLALSYSACINQINSILFATKMVKVGGYDVKLPILDLTISFDVEQFPPTIEGKMQAISTAFRNEVEHIHALMTVKTISAFAEGIGFEATRTLKDIMESLSKTIIALSKDTRKDLKRVDGDGDIQKTLKEILSAIALLKGV